MALSPTQEAQVVALIDKDSELLTLADNEAAIISNLGSTDVSLTDLTAATSLDDTDLMLVRQGVTDKSISGLTIKTSTATPDASETVKGKIELATNAETVTGTDTVRATHPAGVKAAIDAARVSNLQSITVEAASNALTGTYNGGTLGFRSGTLGTGTPTTLTVGSLSITIPTGATLGAVNAVAARFVYAVANNAGTPVLCVANIAGGLQMDETNLISPTTISAGATSSATWYSASAVAANSAYRVIGFADNTQATAGTYATQPSLVQGMGGQALVAMSSFGYGQTWTNVTGNRATGTTYYNTTGKPIQVSVSTNNLSTAGGFGHQFFVNGVAVAIQIIPGASLASNNAQPNTSIIVQPGCSYSATATSANLYSWFELR